MEFKEGDRVTVKSTGRTATIEMIDAHYRYLCKVELDEPFPWVRYPKRRHFWAIYHTDNLMPYAPESSLPATAHP